MSNTSFENETIELPFTKVKGHKKNKYPQLIWLIPILAVLIGLSLVVKGIIDKGPTITIAFKSGEGLEAGKTHVKYKDMEIGLVKAISLDKDRQKVIATIQLEKDTSDFLKEDTRFWIVKPRITANGVSGLNTLLSGSYIVVDRGHAEEERKHFVALDVPPIQTQDTPGREFTLRASTLDSHEVGTPVFYRRLTVGQVVGYGLDDDGKGVSIKVFINAPYDQYVKNDSRFWNVSGVDVSLDATGFKVKTESIVSILAGGISFSTPENLDDKDQSTTNESDALKPNSAETNSAPSDRAVANTVFKLYKSREIAMKRRDVHVEHFVLNFKQSVRGLSVGAPVDFRGVNIGEVLSISTAIDPKTFEITQPVEISLYAERLRAKSKLDGSILPFPKTRAEELNRIKIFLKKGLRAQLQNGNFLTGQKYLAIDFFPKAPSYTLDTTKYPLELPVVPGALDDIESSIARVVKNTDKLVNEIHTTTLPELNKTLVEVQNTLNQANSLVDEDSPLQTDTRLALRELTKTSDSLKKLTDSLDKSPQSLIFGKPVEKEKP
jgi:paraquat-inducible protein B